MTNLYFHGTTAANRQAILRNGFQEGRDGRFGSGIYFAKHVDLALDYGEALLSCQIEMSSILKLHYLDIPALFGEDLPTDKDALDAFLEEAEGFPTLKEWVLSQGYLGCEIEYHPDDTELVVYDPRVILNGNAIEPYQTEAGPLIFFPIKQFDPEEESLTHIGTLNPQDKGDFSYEGHGLSVSTCPEEWQRIARLGGRWYTLFKVNHGFLNFYQLTKEQEDWIIQWGLDGGYVFYQTAYEVSYWDDEEDCERFSLYESYEEALQEMEDKEPVETQVLKASTRLLKRLNCQIPLGLTFDLLTTLFVEDVLQWDGVFWDDDHGVWSAPRAVIVPKQLPTWNLA